METEGSQPVGSDEMEACTENVEERNCPIMPNEDDIEKSFRINEDGSMTVEMKVHLTIKQEEMIHWTTTLSRTSVNSQQRAVCNSKPESRANSVDITNDSGKESNGPHSLESKEINTVPNKSVGFIKEERENYGSDTSSEKPIPIYRRLPTPAPRQHRKEVSVENIKTVSETEVQESTVGAYSYMERTAQGELMEGYCVVSRSSSSSTRTVSKPGKSELGEIKQKKSHSSFRSSGVAEVLQLQNNETMGITETVVHIYESQGTCDNYYANTQMDADNKPGYCTKALPQSKPGSTDSGPCSSSNDCDVDLTKQSTSSNSLDGGKSNMLSLSSDRSTPPKKINSNLSILTDDEKQSLVECTSETIQKKIMHPATEMDSSNKSTAVNKNNSPKSKKSKQSTSSGSSRLGRNIKGSAPSSSKALKVTSDTISHRGSEKKSSSAESHKHEHKAVRDENKKTKTFESSPKSKNMNLDNGNQRPSDKDIKLKDKTMKDTSHKVNTNNHDSQGPKLKKSSLDIESPAHSAKLIKRLPKQRSMNGVRSKTSKSRQELSESVSLPVLQSSSTSVNQYVENWLKRIEPESLPYEDETDPPEIVPRAAFQIGADSTEDSEIKSNPNRDSIGEKEQLLEDHADESPMSHPPVQIRCEGEPVEPQKTMGFCKSMPILRLPSEQEGIVRMHKSSEHLFPPEPSGTSQSTEVSVRSGMKPVLQQLCLSVQSIKHALSKTLTSGEREKSSSLPDFSSQVASAFGSPSRALLSFLSVMTLRDGLSVLYKNKSETGSSNDCPEALQVMQSLEKMSNIKDEDELRASLTSLRSSTSSKLNQSWKDFQEQNIYEDSPPLSPRLSEQEFAVEVDLEGEMGDQDKQHNFSIAQLLDELNMPEHVQREISSLVEGELKYFTQSDLIKDAENISEITGKEEENDDGSLGGSLEKAAEMEEERENIGQDNDAANKDITNDPKHPEPSEMHLIQCQSPYSETVEKDFCNEDSGIAVPNQSPEGNGSDSSKAEALKMSNNNQMNGESLQEKVMYEDLESENKDAEGNHSSIAEDDLQEQKMITEDVAEDVSEFSDDQDNMSEREENIMAENIETDEKENDTIQDMRETSEQSDASETGDTDAKHSCLASETECVPFSDREAAEINEDNQYSTAEDCVKEEVDHSDFEDTISDEGGQEQENKSILSEGESLPLEPSETSTSHHDTEGEFREETIQSSSQEEDQVMSPDIKDADEQEDTTPEVSEDEDSEPHLNNSSPHHGSNVENSRTPETDYEKSQQTENYLVEDHDINKVDYDGSDVCKQIDSDAEQDSSTMSDPEVTEKKANTSDSKLQTLVEDSLIDKKDSSAEECDAEEVDHSSLLDSHNNIIGLRNSIVCTNTTDSVKRESCSSTITSVHQFENTESLGMEHGYHYLPQPTEISQELLDLINSALLSSTLTVTCDSNGNLRIEPDKCKMKEMFMAGQRTDDQYGQKRLPSPNTSDLSDYRPETSDIGGYQSQEFFTESGDEETERLRIFQEILKQSSEKPSSRNHVKEKSSMESPTWMATKHTGSPCLKSSSVSSFQDTKSAIHEPLCHSVSPSNKSSLNGDAEPVQGMTLKDKINSEEGVLIDKGRWLLKENHLIRNSPPVSIGMYGNEDTTSADTVQDNRSEDSSHQYCENQASPLAAISSSELEDMVKPPTPKCTYFNMAHSSDSDPLIDAQSVRSSSGGGDARRKRELKVSPMGESSHMWAKKNGSMSSFASLEFKLPDGKIHPQEGSSSGVHRSQSQDIQTVQEEESRVGLNLRCGQHCPIL